MADLHTREQILTEARNIVVGERNAVYGEPERNFVKIAAMWSAYKGVMFEPHDVAVMLVLLKVARISISPEKADHWVDIAGYAACGGEIRPAPDLP